MGGLPNILTIGLWMMVAGKIDPRFLTFKQAFERGGSIRKGSKGIPIVFYGTFTRDNDQGEEVRSRFAKIKHVFHLSDLDGAEVQPLDPCIAEPRLRNANIDAFVTSTGIPVIDGGSAYYQDTTDSITIPPIGVFREMLGVSAEDLYYSTLLHELIHATGPAPRLNRDCFLNYHKDRKERAFEELIAEIGSVMLGQRLGLMAQPREDNAAYVANWAKLLKDKPGSIFSAASAASRAIAHLEEMTFPKQEAAE